MRLRRKSAPLTESRRARSSAPKSTRGEIEVKGKELMRARICGTARAIPRACPSA
ncbi:MAG: hypothetical protein M3680_19620 [Myxococcota bacterium]|nr:hypothetical protein [Myxococcota bacterium]